MINGKNTVVIALGGNAILQAGQKGTQEEQYQNLRLTVSQILPFLLRSDINVVITHGNGPQVGNALLRSEQCSQKVPPYTLDVCGAETQGSIGFMLIQTLQEELYKIGSSRIVVSLITRTLVNPADQAFANPTKFIGPFYSQEQAKQLTQEKGWTVREDSGRGYRRVVASPLPQEIIEYPAIFDLLTNGYLVVSTGGGGIPVVSKEEKLRGIEAVIDKDLASAVLAVELKASQLIILTEVSQVCLNYKKPDEVKLSSLSLEEAKTYLAAGEFPPGSMGPKITAAINFLENIDGEVLITSSKALYSALKGEDGTFITR